MVSGVGLAATGCGGDAGGGDVTLKLVAAEYGTPGNSAQEWWDGVVSAFRAQHPEIGVDVTIYGWSEVDRKVAEMVEAGEAPDIAQIGSYADYAANGDIYPAGDLLSIPVQADFLPGLAQAGELRRTQYGLPFAASTRLLFYNKSLFRSAGLDPEKPPTTWEELREAARVLEEAGVEIPYALPLGPEEAQAETMLWMLSGGGGYTNNVGTYTIDSEENVRTFTWLRDKLVRGGLIQPQSPAKTNRQAMFDAFAAGRVGMLNGHPVLIEQSRRNDVEYGTAPLPGRDGVSQSTMGVADWIMGFKQRGHRAEIGTFLDFLFGLEQYYTLVERFDLLPVTTSASDRMSEDDDQKHLQSFLEQLPAAVFYPVDKVSWSQTSRDIKETIGEAVHPGGSAENLLGSLQRKALSAESAAL
ncbi:sugar ABC transporter substrate-binding protein [Streptomyces sp. TRM70308]|uniref:ABC transporter substrate-binding protein n=1 Tax=Streptomyces sp. TRM70308 TaxID=3131932 RepID=UPI002248D1D5|nr:sugar ABC transporter substrate-binding protein [Streptomyces sp. JHD 1]MCX2968851.1 sugar ABC transporter substrate-binding protein [Streptomyces sp. JHD 1]